MTLESVLCLCREADPEGIYELETEPLSYNVKGIQSFFEGEQQEHRMFLRLHVMPSASIQWWKHSRKIMSADAAHLRGQLDGVVNMLTGIDANNQNFTLMYTICGTENEVHWNSTLSRAASMLDNDIDAFISDRDKGLLAVTGKMKKDRLKSCVFTACVLHLAKNAGIKKAEAITVVTKMAKAPNADAFEKHLQDLQKLCSEEAVKFMVVNKGLYALHAIKEKASGDFFTNYGQSSSNASEQQNNAFKSFRDMPYVTGLITLLQKDS